MGDFALKQAIPIRVNSLNKTQKLIEIANFYVRAVFEQVYHITTFLYIFLYRRIMKIVRSIKLWTLLILATICTLKKWDDLAYLFGTKGQEIMTT